MYAREQNENESSTENESATCLNSDSKQCKKEPDMEITHGPHVWDVNMKKVDEIKWTVSEYNGSRLAFAPKEVLGKFYWNVRACWGDHNYFILESGVIKEKVDAFTRARGRARFYRGERHRERAK